MQQSRGTMNPWEGIAEFLMVVETGGFSKAAKRLGVSVSHVPFDRLMVSQVCAEASSSSMQREEQ